VIVTEDKMSVLGLYLLLGCCDLYEAPYNVLRSFITEHKKRFKDRILSRTGRFRQQSARRISVYLEKEKQ